MLWYYFYLQKSIKLFINSWKKPPSTETTNYHKGVVYLQKHPLQRQQIITKELSIFIQTPSTETTNYHKGVVYLQKHPLQRQQIITKELSIFKNTLYRDNKLSQRSCLSSKTPSTETTNYHKGVVYLQKHPLQRQQIITKELSIFKNTLYRDNKLSQRSCLSSKTPSTETTNYHKGVVYLQKHPLQRQQIITKELSIFKNTLYRDNKLSQRSCLSSFKHPLQRQQIITKELSIFKNTLYRDNKLSQRSCLSSKTPSTETTNYHKGVVYLQKHPLQRQQIITKELSIFKNTLYRDNKLSQRSCLSSKTPSTETTNYHKGVVYLQKHPLQRQQIITKELSIFKNTLYRDNKLSQRSCLSSKTPSTETTNYHKGVVYLQKHPLQRQQIITKELSIFKNTLYRDNKLSQRSCLSSKTPSTETTNYHKGVVYLHSNTLTETTNYHKGVVYLQKHPLQRQQIITKELSIFKNTLYRDNKLSQRSCLSSFKCLIKSYYFICSIVTHIKLDLHK